MAVSAAELTALSRYDPLVRLNAICPYYTMFPLEFPLRVLDNAAADEAVLDPFCGRGTTVYAARLLGLLASGIDANPVAAALSRAKLANAPPGAVQRRCGELLGNGYEPTEIPTGEFWRRCFATKTLRDICSLREQLLDANDTDATVLLRALLLGVLHGPLRVKEPSYLSNQMPRSYASKPAYASGTGAPKDCLDAALRNELAAQRRRVEQLPVRVALGLHAASLKNSQANREHLPPIC